MLMRPWFGSVLSIAADLLERRGLSGGRGGPNPGPPHRVVLLLLRQPGGLRCAHLLGGSRFHGRFAAVSLAFHAEPPGAPPARSASGSVPLWSPRSCGTYCARPFPSRFHAVTPTPSTPPLRQRPQVEGAAACAVGGPAWRDPACLRDRGGPLRHGAELAVQG